MKQYEHFVEWVRLLALFSAVFAADFVLKGLEEHKLPASMIAILVGLVAIFALHVAEFAAVKVIEKFGWLKRWILGPQWIEGLWFDQVVGHNQFALVSIAVNEGVIRVNGEQFDAAGNVTATWESYVATLDGNTLYTSYRSPQFADGKPADLSGFSTYVFTGTPGSAPSFYSGCFVDAPEGGRRCQLRGFRITDKAVISQLMNPIFRRSQLITLIQQHTAALLREPGLPVAGRASS